MRIHLIILYTCLFAVFLPVRAQDNVSDSIGGPAHEHKRFPLTHRVGIDIRPGYMTQTSSFFQGNNAKEEPIRKTFSAHLKYAFQFHPDSPEGAMYPHTYQGIGVAYNTFGSSELGNPISVYAFQSSRIARMSRRLSLDYEWNFGASFNWNPYDRDTNPYNRVIGSKINAYINLGFFLNWQLAAGWNLTAGADFTHYSNGNTHFPNTGANPIGGRIGLVYTFNPLPDDRPATSRRTDGLFRPHLNLDFTVYAATRRKGVFLDGQGYAVPSTFGVIGFNLAPMYSFNKYFKAGISIDGQYDESANIDEHIANPETPDDLKFYRPPLREQVGVGLSLRGEFTMPLFSINAGIGRNVIYHGDDMKGTYQILALKVSVTRNLFLHIGYQLRRFRDPNNLMLGFGYRFFNQRRVF